MAIVDISFDRICGLAIIILLLRKIRFSPLADEVFSPVGPKYMLGASFLLDSFRIICYPLRTMLKIRLQRIGKKGQAYFRVVVIEHTQKPKGRYLELLGNYDPHKNVLNAKKERVEYWMSKGAQLSPTVNNLLVGREIIKGGKVQVWKAKKKAKAAEAKEVKKEAEPEKEIKSETVEPTESAPAAVV